MKQQTKHQFKTDPFKWPDHLQNCTGKQQSPINVNWARVKKMDGPSLEFHNYDSALPMAMMNNGHSGQSSSYRVHVTQIV